MIQVTMQIELFGADPFVHTIEYGFKSWDGWLWTDDGCVIMVQVPEPYQAGV